MVDNYKVYLYIFPNGKMYCGQTKNTIEMRAGHNGIRYKECPKLWNAIQKYGWDNIEKQYLYTNLTSEEADLKEQETILKFNLTDDLYGYNISQSKQNNSSADRQYLSQVMKKHWSDQTYREKCLATLQSPTYKEKMSEIIKEKWNDPDFITKQQKAHLQLMYLRGTPVLQLDKDTQEVINIYPSASEAARILNPKLIGTNSPGNKISAVCRGSRKTTLGYGWRYIKDDEEAKFYNLVKDRTGNYHMPIPQNLK